MTANNLLPAEPGWKLVPTKPTLEMLKAGVLSASLSEAALYQYEAESIYAAMLSAAPTAPVGEGMDTSPAPDAWVNGDELDNMLDDRTATIQGERSGWRGTPLYRAPSAAAQQVSGLPQQPSVHSPALSGERTTLAGEAVVSTQEPVAWRFRYKHLNEWHLVDYEAEGPNIVVEPLFLAGAVEQQTVERCARHVDNIADGIAAEYGQEDPDTGTLEFRKQAIEDGYNTMRELADEIRALAALSAAGQAVKLTTEGKP